MPQPSPPKHGACYAPRCLWERGAVVPIRAILQFRGRTNCLCLLAPTPWNIRTTYRKNGVAPSERKGRMFCVSHAHALCLRTFATPSIQPRSMRDTACAHAMLSDGKFTDTLRSIFCGNPRPLSDIKKRQLKKFNCLCYHRYRMMNTMQQTANNPEHT